VLIVNLHIDDTVVNGHIDNHSNGGTPPTSEQALAETARDCESLRGPARVCEDLRGVIRDNHASHGYPQILSIHPLTPCASMCRLTIMDEHSNDHSDRVPSALVGEHGDPIHEIITAARLYANQAETAHPVSSDAAEVM